MDGKTDQLCSFCRTPAPKTDEEAIIQRVEIGDARAIRNLGGDVWFTTRLGKLLELWYRAAELGCAEGHCSIGQAYFNGSGVERNEKKATHCY